MWQLCGEWNSQVSGTDLSLTECLEGNSTAKFSLKIEFEARQTQSRSKAQLFQQSVTKEVFSSLQSLWLVTVMHL